MGFFRYNRTYSLCEGGMGMYVERLNDSQQSIIILSLILLVISIGIHLDEYNKSIETYTLSYEAWNTKNMTKPNIATKVSHPDLVDESINNSQESLGTIEEATMGSLPMAEELPTTEDAKEASKNAKVWYLPTQNGNITTYPNYGHVAYDITSWRGTAETVYPVADGVISGIYTDSFGALVVTVLHNVDGVKYTSQYVHLSSYANGIYVGMPVTINSPLGQMGSTGWSTGVHLHVAVLDCALFDPNDPNCNDLNGWYRYDKKRLSENFFGLGVLVYVPQSWNSR